MFACTQSSAADCPGTSQQGRGEYREPSSGSAPKDSPATQNREEGESYVLTSLRTRCKEAERQLKVVQAAADVALSKEKLAAECEDFLMGELTKMSRDLLCK